MSERCSKCQTVATAGAAFCSHCGSPLGTARGGKPASASPEPRSSAAAGPTPTNSPANLLSAASSAYSADSNKPAGIGHFNDTTAGNPSDPTAAGSLRRGGVSTEPEQELWHGGYSPKAMYGVWILMTLATLGTLGLAAIMNQRAIWIAAGLGILLVWIYQVGLLLYRQLSIYSLLTSQRFVYQSGLLRRRTDKMEVIDMDDIAYEQGLIERFTGTGTLTIISSDRTHPNLRLLGIANIAEVSRVFDSARRNERRRRGLHIENI